jgi:hypothetical protein
MLGSSFSENESITSQPGYHRVKIISIQGILTDLKRLEEMT